MLDDATAAVERGNWAEAVRCAEAVLAAVPGHAEAEGIVTLARRRAARAARESGARRQLTVLFCDVVGSTEYATKLDAEEMREMLGDFQKLAAANVERYDGYIQRFMGDGFIAFFGYPRGQEDAPRRAVLAGLDLIEAIGASADEHRMTIRVGIHTGLVVVADIGGDTPTAPFGDTYGETIHIAARLETAARPGTVVVSNDTATLISGFFAIEPLGPHTLKGIDRPIELFRVTHRRDVESRLEAVGARTPLVGRESERTALLDAWQRARSGGNEILFIRGEAGIGKSRLVEVVQQQAEREGGTVVVLQCSPYHSGTALFPARRALARLAEVAPDATPAERADAMLAFLRQHDVSEAADIVAVSTLFGLDIPHAGGAPSLSPEQVRERIFALVVRLLDMPTPLLLVAEDLHWADPSTIELIRRIASSPANSGRLVAATSRPEAEIGLASDVLTLGPLPEDQTRAIVSSLAAGTELTDETIDTIVGRSDGVPLFVEELTRVVRGDVQLGRGQGSVPPTLSDLLIARLDQFPVERPIAQVVATVGRPVSLEFLEALAITESATLLPYLSVLVDAGILRASESPRTYEFGHALLRDAAYESQLLTRRRALHSVIAEALTATAGEEDPDLVAHHHEEAGDPAHAAEWLHRAAARSIALAALPEALDRLEKAITLIEGLSDPPARLHFEIQRDLATCLMQVRGYTSPETEAASAKALDLSAAGDISDLVPTMYGLYAYYTIRADYESGWQIAERCTELARRSGDRSDAVESEAMMAYVQMMRGNVVDARDKLQRAADSDGEGLPLRLPHSVPVACRTHLATVELVLGRPELGDAHIARALEAAAQLDEAHADFQLAYTHVFASFHNSIAGDHTRAIGYSSTAVQISAAHGFMSWFAAGALGEARARMLSDPSPATIEGFINAYGMMTGVGVLQFGPWCVGALGEAYLRIGDLESARRRCDEAITLVHEHGEELYKAEAFRVRGEVLLAAGDAAGVADLETAVATAREQQARWFELRALTRLQRATDGAYSAELEALLGSLDEGLDTADVQAARETLKATSR